MSRNIAQSIGPAFAGAIIAAINPGAVFALNAISFVGIVVVMQTNKSVDKNVIDRVAINEVIKNGIKHVVGTRLLRNLALRLAIMLGVTSVLTSVLPIVAKQSLGVASSGYGLLSGALGIGSVTVVWVLPRIRAKYGIESITIFSAGIWSASTAVLASTTSMLVAFFALLVCGACTMAMLNTIFSAFMMQLPNELRGRGSSLAMMMVWLGIAIGTFVWGATTSIVGVGDALVIAATTNFGLAIVNRFALRITIFY
ncbi:unannotated protein [freshwater metagenome]|uniref:Unannotated protein n=1 Tax=freshwater metagenome TaxID=449393 RepID=A0A6J6XWA3_9ZZZZ